MSASLSDLLADLQPYAHQLVDAAGAARLNPQVTSTLRSRALQTRLYRDYLRGGRGYPVAPPGTSAHEFGYAFDMVVAPMEALWDVGQYWKNLGGVWGPGDAIHFEYPGFRTDFPNLQAETLGPVSTLVEEAMSILNNPLVSLFLPAVLSVQENSGNMDAWAAQVVKWYRENF